MMACIRIPNGVICYAGQIFEYDGFVFEMHDYLGPSRLRKDTLDPVKPRSQTKRFWDAFEKWNKLSKREKEKTSYKQK